MSHPRQILILTNGPLARNPRVCKEATALGGAGYVVTVLGVRNHSPSAILDRELTVGAPFQHTQIEMQPGTGVTAWLRRLRIRLARELAQRGGPASVHSLGPAIALLRAAKRIPADLVIAHNEIAHWAALRLQAQGQRIAADLEDWHSEDLLPEARAGRPLKLLRQQERALLHTAAYVTTTSHALADALHARYGGKRPAVVTNSFPLSKCREPTVSANHLPALFWFSQTIGPGRGLERFVDAWVRTSTPSTLTLMGEPVAGFDVQLCFQLPESFTRRLNVLQPVAPRELPSWIARHDIGLALEPSTPANKNLTISNKILQYLNAGLAVVATPTAGQREVLAKAPDAGILLDSSDPDSAARQLDALLIDRATLRHRQTAARQLAEQTYCWDLEKRHLLKVVDSALSS